MSQSNSKFNHVKLDKEVNFITAQELLNEVRNKLKTYFESSALDDSDMYPIIRSCLSSMGAKVYPVSSGVIIVDNHKASLPKDFHKLILALGCTTETVISIPNTNPHLYEKNYTVEEALKLDSSTVCLNNCGDYYQVIQKFEAYELTFNNVYPLSVTRDSAPYCSKDCWNKKIKGVNEINIDPKKGCIYTEFEEGSIFIEYMQNLESNDPDGPDLLIPDFAPLREWIKAACIKEGLEMLYLNGEPDLERRLQYAKNELAVKEIYGRSYLSRPEFREFYDLRKVFYGRFDKFNQMVL